MLLRFCPWVLTLLAVSCTAVDKDEDTSTDNLVEGGPSCPESPPTASSAPALGDAGGEEQTLTEPNSGTDETSEPAYEDAAAATSEPDPTLAEDAGSSTPPTDGEPATETSEPATDAGAMNVADGGDTLPPCAERCYQVAQLESEGNEHVTVGTEVQYGHNPPASGAHFPVWAKYGVYDEVVPRSYWVHNLEHGSVVFLYGPSATEAQQAELRAAYDALPNDDSCGSKRAILTPDPELDDAIAIVTWTWVLEASCVDQDAIIAFATQHRGNGLEAVCGDGSFEP